MVSIYVRQVSLTYIQKRRLERPLLQVMAAQNGSHMSSR